TPESDLISAFWTINDVVGGAQIALKSNQELCIDLNATSSDTVSDGTTLILGIPSSPNFTRSNLWSVGSLDNPGTASQIESIGSAGDYVIDSGSAPTGKVWTDLNNSNQTWQVLEVQ
ncbi:MAG: hypothetical protein ABJ201_07925, partial [Nisaea sp.]